MYSASFKYIPDRGKAIPFMKERYLPIQKKCSYIEWMDDAYGDSPFKDHT